MPQDVIAAIAAKKPQDGGGGELIERLDERTVAARRAGQTTAQGRRPKNLPIRRSGERTRADNPRSSKGCSTRVHQETTLVRQRANENCCVQRGRKDCGRWLSWLSRNTPRMIGATPGTSQLSPTVPREYPSPRSFSCCWRWDIHRLRKCTSTRAPVDGLVIASSRRESLGLWYKRLRFLKLFNFAFGCGSPHFRHGGGGTSMGCVISRFWCRWSLAVFGLSGRFWRSSRGDLRSGDRRAGSGSCLASP